MNHLTSAIKEFRLHLCERKWIRSARKEIRASDMRRHQQSAYQTGERHDRISSKEIACGAAIVFCVFLVIFIEGYGKPDPKQTVQVRK